MIQLDGHDEESQVVTTVANDISTANEEKGEPYKISSAVFVVESIFKNSFTIDRNKFSLLLLSNLPSGGDNALTFRLHFHSAEPLSLSLPPSRKTERIRRDSGTSNFDGVFFRCFSLRFVRMFSH